MKSVLVILVLLALLAIIGCSSGQGNPINLTESNPRESYGSHQLWGMWQFIADPTKGTLEIFPLRSSDFHLNALPFLEPPPLLNLTLESLKFEGNIIQADIGLRHPFLGLTEFTGFDVCGVFITNGSVTGFTDTGLRMAGNGDTRLLNADGYSRWWNPAEYPHGKTMFTYKDGLLGAPDSYGHYNSTINAYKYFCDDLAGPNDPMSKVTLAKRGIFSAGQKNIRHYTIELGTEGLIFNYAVDASWKFPDGPKPWHAPDDFPPDANRAEPWNIIVKEKSNTLWNDGVSKGGNLKLQIDAYDWYNAASNSVRVESPGNFAMVETATATGGGSGYSTYEVEIIDATPAPGSIGLLISVASEEADFEGFLPGKNTTSYFTYTAKVSGGGPTDKFKNIPLRPGVKPFDLAIDPIDGRILIIYNDEEVWRYLPADDYQFPNPNACYYDTEWHLLDPNNPSYTFYIGSSYIDIADNQYFLVCFTWPLNVHIDRAWYDVVDPLGNKVSRIKPKAYWALCSYYVHEAVAWGTDGAYPNNLGVVWGVSLPDVAHLSYSIPLDNYSKEYYYSYSMSSKTGKKWWFRSYVRGAEIDKDDTHLWVLEDVDYYCARFLNVTYDNAYFGTGSQTDADNGFYKPKDLTRDEQNIMLALDELSDGTQRIKAFDPTNSTDMIPAASLGGFNLDDIIIGPALRLDCGDYVHPTYGNILVVMHGDSTQGYYMSVFFPDELPW